MIIGATWEQVPLIETAKHQGHTVLATDPNPNAVGLALADETAILQPRDLNQALAIAKKHQIQGVTADECDYSHYAATFISASLGLPHAGMAAAQVTTNKRWMRERCREHHILQPRFVPCRTMDDVNLAADLIGFPLIIKPTDNRGSFGVHKLDRAEQLEAAYLDALMNAHSREILVEAYIEGIHITVDGCVDQTGQHHNLGIASKQVTPGEKPIITEVLYPAAISEEMTNHVLKTNNKVVEALGITNGATHSEYIVDEKGRCFLLETANRGGGVLTSGKIIPEISGVNISELLIANALGEPYEVHSQLNKQAAMLTFFVFESGTVKAISGIEEAENIPGVLHLQLRIKPGDVLLPPQSGAGRHGFGILTANNSNALQNLREKVVHAITLEYQ
ncbi:MULTISPECIES: ATP-grasp domain-containing protein [unclassified Moorena]|uniref:ATP-grasp domain-containing protein n=1 Tax=unclassified Moorena TaxID=2683338 RepID=UPI001400FB73|nr:MULTISPECIES: ATP-grasp domain-containing protein [unclassified Moorena]NEO12170.1 ATP-grasp domain-containing protein [Moorena sp. SIO3E8]NEQ00916.1 ATP-grasp domain-containing protein [Moorena sp. SIO3F7]